MTFLSKYSLFINGLIINIVSFVTILIFGLIIGRFLGKLIYKILNELGVDEFLTRNFKAVVDIEKITGKFVQYLVYFASFIYALYKVGIPLKSYFYLLVVIIIIFAAFIFLEIKDYFHNLIIGMFFIDKKFLKIGQKTKIKKIEGYIVKISNIEIKIVTDNNDTYFIPNAVLRKSSLFKKENNY